MKKNQSRKESAGTEVKGDIVPFWGGGQSPIWAENGKEQIPVREALGSKGRWVVQLLSKGRKKGRSGNPDKENHT